MHTFITLSLLLSILLCSNAHGGALQLDSAQERLLNDARYYLKDVDKRVAELTKAAEDLKAGRAPIDANRTQALLNQVNWAGGSLNNALTRLAQLPAGDASVKPVAERARQRARELLAAESVFESHAAGKQAAVASIDATQLKLDTECLEGLSRKIANEDFLIQYPDESLAVVLELDKLIRTRDDLERQYTSILDEFEGRQLKNTIEGFDHRLARYREGMQRAAGMAPERARGELQQADRIAGIAVERRDVSSFLNGVIAATLGRAQVQVALLTAIDPGSPELPKLQAELTATAKRLEAAHASLASDILARNAAPHHIYGGQGQEQILEAVRAEWIRRHPRSEVLGLRIPMRDWERRETWRWALDEFQRYDESRLQVAIVVKADAERAHVFYAHLKKNHLSADALEIVLDDQGEVPLYRTLLLKNWN